MRKVGHFGPVSPNGQGDRSNYLFPTHRTAQILTQSKNSDKAIFHTENAGLLSKSAVFAPRTYASLVVGGFQGDDGKPNLLMAAVRTLCVCCAETPPLYRFTSLSHRAGSHTGASVCAPQCIPTLCLAPCQDNSHQPSKQHIESPALTCPLSEPKKKGEFPLVYPSNTLGGNVGAPGAPGKVATVTVPPSTLWGHVSVWDFLT